MAPLAEAEGKKLVHIHSPLYFSNESGLNVLFTSAPESEREALQNLLNGTGEVTITPDAYGPIEIQEEQYGKWKLTELRLSDAKVYGVWPQPAGHANTPSPVSRQ